MPNTNLFDEEVGLLKIGSIIDYDAETGFLKVRLNGIPTIKGNASQPIDVPAPHSLFYNNGLFIGTLPVSGTPIVISQGSGGQYYFVSFLAENLPAVPELTLGELLIRANDDTKIALDVDNNINIGSDDDRIHINTERSYITTAFDNENHFTQAARKVEGLVKRDLRPSTKFDPDSKLENDDYDENLFIIGLDPTSSANFVSAGANKNPPFVEYRELVYEFQPTSEVNDDLSEAALYSGTPPTRSTFTLPNRRKSRSDTLSLSLVAPNYLMETIKGTVVDIFGNLLDLNRIPLAVGLDQNTLRSTSADKSASYQLIRELERRSLAYHFEINARKDLAGLDGLVALPDITSNEDYARNRSRFFFDIDKEGQFKLNVPASSEKGNIPLLTRYENYSTFGADDNNNPNKLVFRTDNLDIFHDSFASSTFRLSDGYVSTDRGSIHLQSGAGAEAAPVDRITGSPIRHGTAYHDILSTCYLHQNNDPLKYVFDPDHPVFARDAIDGYAPLLVNIATDTIIIDGYTPNAGGRSGSINLDGSIDVSIGANTIDRQSVWFDTAGGMVCNIGRDGYDRSAVVKMDGSVFLQMGGLGVSTDSRFITKNNASIGAVLDIRILNSGNRCTWIRVDDDGVKILTPGHMNIHSQGDMKISSDCDISIECENLKIQNRGVLKEFGGSI